MPLNHNLKVAVVENSACSLRAESPNSRHGLKIIIALFGVESSCWRQLTCECSVCRSDRPYQEHHVLCNVEVDAWLCCLLGRTFDNGNRIRQVVVCYTRVLRRLTRVDLSGSTAVTLGSGFATGPLLKLRCLGTADAFAVLGGRAAVNASDAAVRAYYMTGFFFFHRAAAGFVVVLDQGYEYRVVYIEPVQTYYADAQIQQPSLLLL